MKNYLKNHLFSSRVWLLAMIFCTGLTQGVFAQDSKGTEFWICFPGNLSNTSTELYITGPQASIVTIDIPGISFNQVVNVPAGGLQVVTLPSSVQVQTQFSVSNQGIHITASNEVTVYGMNAQNATTDAFLAFPTDALGTQYYVMAYNKDFQNLIPTQATIVATQNNTTVTITSSLTDGPFTVDVPSDIILQQGEVYQLRSINVEADYSGTKITADKPVSVFGGAQCTNISGTLRACDHLVEQIPPLTTWGKSFLTVPLATRTAGDVFRFMAQVNGTAVSVNGAVVANLDAGKFFETILPSGSYNHITSNQPILVGQYCRSSQADNVTSDPFFALVPSDEQTLTSYVVSAGTANIPSNFLNITSPSSNVGDVTVDGITVNAGLWNPIQATGFSGATVPVATGVHTVSSPRPVGLLVYGFGSFDSYGYLGGQSFSPVATVTNLVLAPDNATSPVNISRCFTATVTDQFGAPVVGVRVDFAVSGPNPTNGFANTDASGVATFCYTGTIAGTDNITASVGSVNDATNFIWTPVSNTCNLTLGTTISPNPTVTWQTKATIFKGFGPQAVTLTAVAGGGSGTYSYHWSTGATTASILVSCPGKTTCFTVTVKDCRGCTKTATVTVYVVDVRCGVNMIKVCQKVPGTNNTVTECVPKSTVLTRLQAGDKLGACVTPPPPFGGGSRRDVRGDLNVASAELKAGQVKAFPNPAKNFLDVQWKAVVDQNETVINVFDVKGVLVMSYKAGNTNIKRLDISKLNNGLYMLQVLGAGETALTSKFIVQK